MTKSLSAGIFCMALLLFSACSNDSSETCEYAPEAPPAVVVNWVSLEDSLPAIQSKEELVSYFGRHVTQRDIFFNRTAYPDDSIFIQASYQKFTHPSIDTVLMETKRVFGKGEALRSEFEKAFSNLRFYYPDMPIPKIETVITGMESDLFVSDSLIMVGLDYFLGKGATYRPDMYAYMLRRYQPNFVVPSAMLLIGIDSRINQTDPQDKTVLADMITYGKAFYFAKRMMPCTPDSVFIGYTDRETQGAFANQDMIWKRLVEDEVFFSTNARIKQKYIAERPKTIEVGEECPGRIGMWVGWQIVRAYMKQNPNVTLQQLMQTTDAQKILKESRYRPSE